MVMERLEAAQRHPENQDPVRQSAIKQAIRLLRQAEVKDPGPKQERLPPAQESSVLIRELTRIALDLECRRQARRYVELGFPRELGLSGEDYLASLPRFEPPPESFRGRFDIPVLVETRIAPKRQAGLAGLAYYLGGLNVCDWEADPKGYKTPETPYTTWMQDGKKNLKRSVSDVRSTLKIDERGATEYDGVALWIAKPSVLNDHSVDLPGTSFGSNDAPYLHQWLGESRVNCHHVGNAYSRFGSASCGRVGV